MHCTLMSFPRTTLALIVATALPAPALAQTPTLLPGDHVLTGSLCVGGQCTGSEAFGQTDLKLKEFDNRLLFEDTSSGNNNTITTDWEMVANDLSSVPGPQGYFAIRNVDSNRTLLRLDDGAPDNALYVDDSGNLGLGTALPLANLHIESASTAGIRLVRNTSGGLAAHSYDLLVDGNGLRIVEGLSGANPLIIAPSARSGAIVIEQDRLILNAFTADYDIAMESNVNEAAFHLNAFADRIGMGTDTPETALHLFRDGGAASITSGLLVENTGPVAPRGLLTLRNNGQVYFGLEDTSRAAGPNSGRTWNFQNLGGEFRVTTAPGGGSDIEMRLTTGGDMIIEGNYFAASGTELNVPDYVFDDDYDLKPLAEVQAFIDTHSHLPGVPSAADINAQGLNMTDMQMRLLKKVEELTLYTLEQENRLVEMDALRAHVAAQEAALSALMAEVRSLREAVH